MKTKIGFLLMISVCSVLFLKLNCNDLEINDNSNPDPVTYSSSVVLRSTDAGETWGTSSALGKLNSITVTPLGIFIAAGENGIITKSTNGGTNWTPSDQVSGSYSGYNFRDVKSFGNSSAVAVGDAKAILLTYDAGANWSNKNTPAQPGSDLNAVDVKLILNTFVMLAVGKRGIIFYSSNGGLNWVQRTNSYGDFDFLDVKFFPNAVPGNDVALISANYRNHSSDKKIFRTTNYGIDIQEIDLENPNNMANTTPCRIGIGGFNNAICNYLPGEFHYTTDRGQSWHIGSHNNSFWQFNSITEFDSDVFLAGHDDRQKIFKITGVSSPQTLLIHTSATGSEGISGIAVDNNAYPQIIIAIGH
jgi:hypothetical protein